MILMNPNQLELAVYDAEDAFLRVNRLGFSLVRFWGDEIHERLMENLNKFL
ncbi:MerR family transcriptional regulator [Microcystis aeruginosa LEGE 11464]|jgi:very-short-patch-repair endonuclease|uniref:Transcriptional regulator, MerR family domain protein n=2 Tax=Microcystis TaxID=1125 RepID=L7E906_MICAE|nr:transcriptional regulator, MerR family domain protein [Microcystis aeruginosa TAIHU98]MBE9090152.1 MerR family transcriptional regulator [Microcystis aeruginosa LEGE 11464]MCA2622667.1 MerR family transcriptional regulator [Microcystis sp. M19BS1]MCA2633638.1 MerR family transcriptional regulator [Microcystis sp. M20BS1]NCS75976.1 MerR family transcriptional regulator [Microcystis aeruginosa K13-07]REJ43063.1 MAG: MerR family transcriptional regulator [Microcystis flos-aquae TF09]ROI03948.